MVQKKDEKSKKKLIAIVSNIFAVVVIAVIVLVVVLSTSNSKPKEIKLTVGQSASVSMVTAAVAIDKLDGSGSTTASSCEAFRALAEAYDEKTDWFNGSYCKYIIYADYNETANTTTVTLSDGAHAATYVFNRNQDMLLDFEFTSSTTKGRVIIIEN